jgi:hypothetical protein
MATPYTFEHDGAIVEYHPATVGTALARRRILRGLLEAYGYLDGALAPADEWDNMSEYASAMAQARSNAPWWTPSSAPPERMRAAFELFLEQDTGLYAQFLAADEIVKPPKKTIENTTAT